MKINTQYDIDDEVRFKRANILYVGIINSISITLPMSNVNGTDYEVLQTIHYYLNSSYGACVPEADIICKLKEV